MLEHNILRNFCHENYELRGFEVVMNIYTDILFSGIGNVELGLTSTPSSALLQAPPSMEPFANPPRATRVRVRFRGPTKSVMHVGSLLLKPTWACHVQFVGVASDLVQQKRGYYKDPQKSHAICNFDHEAQITTLSTDAAILKRLVLSTSSLAFSNSDHSPNSFCFGG